MWHFTDEQLLEYVRRKDIALHDELKTRFISLEAELDEADGLRHCIANLAQANAELSEQADRLQQYAEDLGLDLAYFRQSQSHAITELRKLLKAMKAAGSTAYVQTVESIINQLENDE